MLAGLVMPAFDQDFIAEVRQWERGGREATVFLDRDGVVLGAVYIDRREGWLPWELRRFLGLGARDTFLHG